MPFSNPITGGQGTLVRPAIKSPNYSAGVSGWSINKDGSAEFNNLTLRGTFFGTNYIINSSGAFFYSGTPANGNLIVAIANASGTDSFGNTYTQGITLKNSGVMTVQNSGGASTMTVGGANGTVVGGSTSAGHFVLTGGASPSLVFNNSSNQESMKLDANSGTGLFMDNTGLTWSYVNGGRYSLGNLVSAGTEPTATAISNAASVSVGGAQLILESGSEPGTFPDRSVMNFFDGTDNTATGNGSNPLVQVHDFDGNSAVDLWLSGSLIATDATGVPRTWQTPSFSANWDTASIFGPAIKYRIDGEDNLWIVGSVQATAGFAAGTNQFGSIPVPYRPAQTWSGMVLHTSSTNVNIEACQMRVTSGGALQFASAAVNANDRFQVNLRFPLGHLS